jgi:hypothetical protein
MRELIHEHAEGVRRVQARAESHRDLYGQARIRCIAVRAQDRWVSALCLGKVFPRGSEPASLASRRYHASEVHLLEEWTSADELVRRFCAINGKSMQVDQETLFMGDRPDIGDSEFLGSAGLYAPFSGEVFAARGNSSPYVKEPLLEHGQPFYATLGDAVREWGEIPDYIGGADARMGNSVLFLPECRAYFLEARASERSVLVRLQLSDRPTPDLRLVGAWRKGDMLRRSPLHERFDVPVTEAAQTLVAPDEADSLDLYLVGPGTTVYDYRERVRLADRAAPAPPTEEQFTQEIQEAAWAGEGERSEFKVFVNLDKGEKKLDEIKRTAIAFANTNGGTIYFGIEDDCRIVGIEQRLQVRAKSDQREARPGVRDLRRRGSAIYSGLHEPDRRGHASSRVDPWPPRSGRPRRLWTGEALHERGPDRDLGAAREHEPKAEQTRVGDALREGTTDISVWGGRVDSRQA